MTPLTLSPLSASRPGQAEESEYEREEVTRALAANGTTGPIGIVVRSGVDSGEAAIHLDAGIDGEPGAARGSVDRNGREIVLPLRRAIEGMVGNVAKSPRT